MKKLFITAAAAALILTTGCTISPQVPELSIPAETEISVQRGNVNYQCTMIHLSDAVDSVTVKAPETLKGLTVRISGGEVTVSRGSLLGRFEGLSLPKDSLPELVREVTGILRKDINKNVLSPQPDGNYTCEGKNEKYSYTLTADSSGKMTSLKIKELLNRQA